jgi:hypothetical protein
MIHGPYNVKDKVTVEEVKFVAVRTYFCPHDTVAYLFLYVNSNLTSAYG